MEQFYQSGVICGALMFCGGAALLLLQWHWSKAPASSDDERHRQMLRRHTMQQEAARRKEIKRVAKQLRPEIEHNLARHGIEHVRKTEGAVKYTDKPGIRTILYSDDAIYFRIDKLPWRNSFTDLLKPDLKRDLELAIGRELDVFHQTGLGVWVIVYLKSGIAGIPKYFPWRSEDNPANAFELLPDSKPFNVAIGMGENRQFYHEDVRSMPHLLIAGATGGGKSTWVNQALTTLLVRLSTRSLKLHLVDLKGGLEFADFANVPHLGELVSDGADVPGLVRRVQREKDRRYGLMKAMGVRELGAYNKLAPALPWVFFVVDEVAALQQYLTPAELKGFYSVLGDVIQQGRAAGIHVWLATQFPNSDFIPTFIKGNITTKVVFATDQVGSNMLLGNWSGSSIKLGGRLFYATTGSHNVECQGPLISGDEMRAALAELSPPEPEITPEDLFRLSIENLGGLFGWRVVQEATAGSVSDRVIKRITKAYAWREENAGPVIDLNGSGRYVLATRGHTGVNQNQLVLIGEHEPSTAQEVRELLGSVQGARFEQQGEPV